MGLYRFVDALVRAETKNEIGIRGIDKAVYLKRDGALMDDYYDNDQWKSAESVSSLLAVSRKDNNDR